MNPNPYQKICPECGETFTGNRLNRIYCPGTCKTRYNNRKAKDRRIAFQERLKSIKEIEKITISNNQVLWHNRGVLKSFEGQEVAISILEAEGFKLQQVTGFAKIKVEDKEISVLYVYDLGYYFIDKQIIKIFKA